MILPKLVPTLQEQAETTETVITRGKSFLFDFTAGDFVTKDGKLQQVDGIESLKIWIAKIIRTEKFKFKIYDTGKVSQYGVTLLDLVNSGYPKSFIEEEMKREITEALLRNPEIQNVTGFTFSLVNRGLSVAFNVYSIYGQTESVVII